MIYVCRIRDFGRVDGASWTWICPRPKNVILNRNILPSVDTYRMVKEYEEINNIPQIDFRTAIIAHWHNGSLPFRDFN